MTGHEQAESCQSEQLFLYHYGELNGQERLNVEQHLHVCPGCRNELTELRRLLAAVPRPDSELTSAEVERFCSRVMEHLPVRRHRVLTRPVLGWSLAGAVVLLLTFNLGQEIPDRTAPPDNAPVKIVAVQSGLPDLELLQNLDLLENFELVLQLDELR